MDLDAVRTFVAVADGGQFQVAADELSITQQAVSKRIAALEADLAVRLFTRNARGARLTIDGQAFLPHARELMRVAARADASVRPGRRALRVDVVNRRAAPAVIVQEFHRTHLGTELDVVTLDADVDAAIAAVEAGAIDVTFHAVPRKFQLPDVVKTRRVIEEFHQLLVGPRHALANAEGVAPAQLAGHRIWMPGLAARGEVARYYEDFATTFGLTIDVIGPVFGNEALLAEIADSSELDPCGRALAVSVARQLRPETHPGTRSSAGVSDVTDLAQRQPTPDTHPAPQPPSGHAARPGRR